MTPDLAPSSAMTADAIPVSEASNSAKAALSQSNLETRSTAKLKTPSIRAGAGQASAIEPDLVDRL
jgi:hypothetical protein